MPDADSLLMKRGCPNIDCFFYYKDDRVIKDGTYYRRDDARFIQRYKCKHCGRKFSSATYNLACYQKKRRINIRLNALLASGVSMRRSALILDIHRMTVKRRLIYLAKKARQLHQKRLNSLSNQIEYLQFDDLITIEHTKMKPLTVTLAVDGKNRTLLGAEVGQIPAFGHLAEKSRRKYGPRESQHKETIKRLFEAIQNVIKKDALIESDEHHLYPQFVRSFFPAANYQQFKGGRGCVVGQGELKKLHFDPLFMLNHSCAMLRANINRLIRKTWCTTKDPKSLKDHLDIYIEFHNRYLIPA